MLIAWQTRMDLALFQVSIRNLPGMTEKTTRNAQIIFKPAELKWATLMDFNDATILKCILEEHRLKDRIDSVTGFC
jgi:hypothetical protein